MFQDSRGLMWISSVDGLNCYDGLNIKVFKPTNKINSIKGQNIQSNFFEDKQGNIWFSTYEAINCYRPKTNDFKYFQANKDGKKISTDYHVFHLDKSKTKLWTKIGSSIYTFNIHRRTFSRIIEKKALAIRFLVSENKTTGKIESIWNWSLTGTKLRKIYPKDKKENNAFVDYGSIYNKKAVIQKAILQDKDSIWVLTNQGLKCVSNYNGRFSSNNIVPKGLSPTEIPLSMVALNSRQLLLWMPDGSLATYNIANNRIVFRWYLHDFNSFVNTDFLGRNMYLDLQHNIWLSISGLGIRYANLNRNMFKYISIDSNSIKKQKIRITSISNTNNGKILITDFSKGLFLFDYKNGITKPVNSTLLKEKELFGLFGDNPERVIFFTANDTYMYRNDTLSRLTANKDLIISTLKLKNGKTLAVSYNQKKLVYFSINSPQNLTPIKGLNNLFPFFRNSFEALNGALFLPYNDEYILACSLVNESIQVKKKIDINGSINGFIDDVTRGKIWVASSYGLYSIDRSTFNWKKIYSNNQSTQQSIQSILADQLGRLWLGTNNGLICYDPISNSSKKYSVLDGLPDIAFTANACALTPDHKMLFATRNGLVSFDPLHESMINDEPKIVLLEFNAIKQRKDSLQKAIINQKINLPFRSNTISFRFQGIEYADPEHVELYYRLEPAEKGWIKIDNAQGKVRYPNLPAGHYTLKLHAKSAAGIWAKEPLVLQIHIATPFEQTSFFWLLVLALVGTSVFFAVRYYSNYKFKVQMAKQNLIEAERNRMMEDLHDGIGSDLTAIKAISEKSMLTAQDQIFKEQFKKILTRSQDAIRSISEITRATEEQYLALGAFLDWVREKVEEFMQDVGMEIDVELPMVASEIGIGAEARQNVWLVIKETLNNMAKHSKADQAALRISIKPNFVVFEIQDNGIGLNMDTLRKGRGMRNMPKRMKNIKGTFQLLPQTKGTLVQLSSPTISILPSKITWKKRIRNFILPTKEHQS